jgi:CBS domain-containing protein
MTPTLREFIRRPLVVVDDSQTLRECASRLAAEQVGVVVVCHSGGAVGVVGERDITRAVADGVDLDATSVTAYMTGGVITIDEDASARDAIASMDRAGVRHLLVTGPEEIVGMLSLRDVGDFRMREHASFASLRSIPVRIAFDVPEADALEQARAWVEDGPPEEAALRSDVPEADALDQLRPVPMEEEEDERRP